MTANPPPSPSPSPPRAFTQGVGTIFQFTGVILFLLSMTLCCASSLLSKETAQRQDLTQIGWRIGPWFYSGQLALSISMAAAVAAGLALAGVGLGLQATRRSAAWAGVLVTFPLALLWIIHLLFAAQRLRSLPISLLMFLLASLFIALSLLALASLREMLASPPPPGHEILPLDYKIPYSHLHADPPDVRLERELVQRRQRLAVQQKELEMMEQKLRKHAKD